MNTTAHKQSELAMQSLITSLYFADDENMCQITDQYFMQPVTSLHSFEAAMEMLPTWALGTLYHVWHDAPETQFICEGYLIVKDLYQDRIRNKQ